jgi:hypothetical protein
MAGITRVGKIYFRVYEEWSIKKEQVIEYLNQLLKADSWIHSDLVGPRFIAQSERCSSFN